MSACVKWAKEHVDGFNVLLKRQLSSVDEGGNVWNQCLRIAHEHACMLREVGLDFEGMVGVGVGAADGMEGAVGLGVNS
jgi:hypothetical protein